MGIAVRRTSKPPLWAIQASTFSRALLEAAKSTPGMAWHPEMRSWVGYIDAVESTADALVAKGLRIDRSALDRQRVGDYRHNLLYAVNGGENRVLREYQKTGVDFLICEAPTGAILSDDMGLGKSATSIVAARAFGGKTIVVCPSSARSVWADGERGEIKKWWPKAFPFIFQPSGVKPKTSETGLAIPSSAQIVVIHIDILWAWVDAIARWAPQNIILDEGHLLQSVKSRRSIAAKELRVLPSVKTCVALTGTPLTNRVRDLWNLIDTVSPGRMGKNFFNFGLRFCDGHQVEVSRDIGSVWKFDGKSNLDILQKRLSRFTLRRTKADVKLELPAKTRQVIRLEVASGFRMNPNAVIDKRVIHSVLARAVDGKLRAVTTLVKEHLETGASVAVFTYRCKVAEYFVDQMSSVGVPAKFIHGGVSQPARDRILGELREASCEGPVMLAATIDCTAVAIDLTFASVGVIAELTYEPHELLQVESRMHRFGQLDSVLIQYPIGQGTIEEWIAEIVIDKLDTFEALIGKTDGLGAALAGDVEEDILKALGNKLLALSVGVQAKQKRRKGVEP
jgi:SNF2 family DNA or RNA helicase